MPKVAALLNVSVLKLILLSVVGFAVATEGRLLPAGAAVMVLARVVMTLEAGGGDEDEVCGGAGDEAGGDEAGGGGGDEVGVGAVTVTTVTMGGGGGGKAVVVVMTVVETRDGDAVVSDVLATSGEVTVTTTTVLDGVSAVVKLPLALPPSTVAEGAELCTGAVTVAVCVCWMVTVVKDASLKAACDGLVSALLASWKLP
jgi:hypothetical protein